MSILKPQSLLALDWKSIGKEILQLLWSMAEPMNAIKTANSQINPGPMTFGLFLPF